MLGDLAMTLSHMCTRLWHTHSHTHTHTHTVVIVGKEL